MKAVMLVGGFGTRLRPLTYTTPKHLLPIADVPMIERKIAHLVRHGITEVVMSMGYLPDAFQQAYPNNECAGARLTYVIEPEPLDTAGAVAFAAKKAGITETFLAMNGDTLVDLDIERLLEFHRSHGAEGTITLTPVDDPSRFGVVPTDDEGRVIAFIEKPAREDAPTNLINAGTYVLEPSFIDRVRPNAKVSIEREVFPAMVAEGNLYAGHFDRYWIDIGTPEAYLQASMDVLDAEYGGDSFVGDGAEVSPDAVLKRSVIGAGAKIAAGCSISDAVLLPGAVLEANVRVNNSVIGRQATIGSEAKLTNVSVVGDNLAVLAGAQLDNQKVNPE